MSSGYLIKGRIVTKPLRWLSGATRSSWDQCQPGRRLHVVLCSWYWNTTGGRHLRAWCRLAWCSINGDTRCSYPTFSGPSLGGTTIIITYVRCPRFTSLKQPGSWAHSGCRASTQLANPLMFAMQVSRHVIVRVLLPALTAASAEIAQPHLSWHANDDDAAFDHPMDSCITPDSPPLLLNPTAHLNCTSAPLAASLDARLE
ncbi:hypothetical protein MRX96_038500 [Rhipicephalus microplus]